MVVFRTKRVAQRYVDAYTGPDTIRCFEQSVGSGSEQEGIALEPDVISKLVGGDVYIFRVGRAVTTLSLSTVGALTSVPETAAIAQAAVDRLTEVL